MADFRKWFLVLTILTLSFMAPIAATANSPPAQQAVVITQGQFNASLDLASNQASANLDFALEQACASRRTPAAIKGGDYQILKTEVTSPATFRFGREKPFLRSNFELSALLNAS